MINGSPKAGRRGPRLILALVLGAAAAIGVYVYVNSVQQTAQQTARVAAQQATVNASVRTRVVVAKSSLPAQAALTPDNVELRDVASDALQPNAAITMNEVTCKMLLVAVAAG